MNKKAPVLLFELLRPQHLDNLALPQSHIERLKRMVTQGAVAKCFAMGIRDGCSSVMGVDLICTNLRLRLFRCCACLLSRESECVWRCGGTPITFWNRIVFEKVYVSTSTASTTTGRNGRPAKYYTCHAQIERIAWINTVERLLIGGDAKMTIQKFKRKSISLDDASVDRCKVLAEDRSTSISGVLRLIIKDAFEEHQRIYQKQESSRSCL